MKSFWRLILFFIDNFFSFRLETVICKKIHKTNGKDSKYTNAIDISIVWFCGGGVGNTGSFIAWIAIRAGSFIAPPPFLHRLKYFPSFFS